MSISIGKNIRKHRQRLNLTQKELGNLLSIPQNSISAFENELRLPDLEIALHMAEIFGISLDELTASVVDLSLPQVPATNNIEYIDASKPIVIHPLVLRSYAEAQLLTDFRMMSYSNKLILLGESQKILQQQEKQSAKGRRKRTNKKQEDNAGRSN